MKKALFCLSLASVASAIVVDRDYTPLPRTGDPRGGNNMKAESKHDYTPLPRTPDPRDGPSSFAASRLFHDPTHPDVLRRAASFVADIFSTASDEETPDFVAGKRNPKSKPKPLPSEDVSVVDEPLKEGPHSKHGPKSKPKPGPVVRGHRARARSLVDEPLKEGPHSKHGPKSKPKPGPVVRDHRPQARALHGSQGEHHGHTEDHGHTYSKPAPKSKPVPQGNHAKPGPKSKPRPKSKPGPPTRPLLGDHVVLSEEDPNDYVYPTSPYVAEDYDTLRAELQLLSTPHAEDYMEVYYMALSTVKGECYVDYMSYCTAQPEDDVYNDNNADMVFSLSIPSPMFSLGSLNSVLNTIFGGPSTYFAPVDEGVDMLAPNRVANDYEPFDELSADSESLNDVSVYSASDGEDSVSAGVSSFPIGAPDGTQSRQLRSDSSSSDSSSFSSSSSSFVEKYLVPLGFGENGDICLYANYEMLTPGCQESITVVYEIRDQYEEEEEHSLHHNGFFVFLLAVVFLSLGVRCCVRQCGSGAQKRMAEKSALNAIRANPALKAQVEAAAGHTLPDADQPKPCCGAMCCRFFIAAAIVFVAMRLTCVLVRDMVYVDDEGYAHEPSGVAVFLIMLAIVILIIGVVRFFQFLYLKYFSSGSASDSHELVEASRRRVQNVFQWSRNLLIRRQPTDYAILSSDDMDGLNNGSELVSRHVHSPVVVSGIPVPAFPTKHQTTVAAVPAQTYTNVTML